MGAKKLGWFASWRATPKQALEYAREAWPAKLRSHAIAEFVAAVFWLAATFLFLHIAFKNLERIERYRASEDAADKLLLERFETEWEFIVGGMAIGWILCSFLLGRAVWSGVGALRTRVLVTRLAETGAASATAPSAPTPPPSNRE